MEKFIPYEKLSKKQKRQLDTQKRRTWGTQNPVTRTPQNSRAYNRKRAQSWKKDLPPLRPLFSFLPQKGAGKRLLLQSVKEPQFSLSKNWGFGISGTKKQVIFARNRSCSNSNLPVFSDSWQHISA